MRQRATKDILMGAPSSCPPCCILLLFSLFYSQTHASNSHNQSCNPNDLRALRSFCHSLDTRIREWPVANPNSTKCCSWSGVHCVFSSSSSPNSSMQTDARVVGLDLSRKGLEGFLSTSLADLDKLSSLNLSNNSFRGPIPPELFQLKLLEVLDLSSNHLSGELPQGIGKLSSLSHLDLSNNGFTGVIPDEFHSLQKLQRFSAASNGFEGQLPASLSSCSMLELLNLWNNSLDGSIDVLDFRRLVRLTTLNLAWNRLNGPIPEVLSSCKLLKILDLNRNNLSGQFPKSLSNLQSFSFLNLDRNGLSNISQALEVLQECRNLTILGLAQNFQGEEMPINGIRGFPILRAFDIANSALTGSIPPWLRNCRELRVLDLSWNRLSGEVASWLGDLNLLFLLNLSNNSFDGEIPVSLTELKSLASGIDLQDDASSSDPPIFYWGWNGRTYEGRKYNHYTDFPPALILSHNKMSGPIWKEFGRLKYLHWLDLGWNDFSGSIPEELSSMLNLEKLDLSFNNLSGSIPSSLVRLTFLSFFSVAHNHLQGLVPSEGQFLSFPCSSFEGNIGLYSNSLRYCNSTTKETYQKEDDDGEDKFVFMGLPFAIGVMVGFLSTVYLVNCCFRKNYNND